MNYRKIKGKSIAECMKNLRKVYGHDAIILGHRQVNDGGLLGLGFWTRKSHEIDYMLIEDTSTLTKKSLLKNNLSNTPKHEINTSLNASYKGSDKQNTLIKTLNKEEAISVAQAKLKTHTHSPATQDPLMIAKQANPLFSNPLKEMPQYLQNIQKKLNTAQLSPAFASDFLSHLTDEIQVEVKSDLYTHSEQPKKTEMIQKKALLALAKRIQTAPSQPSSPNKCFVLMLMGATGCGKSTTLAKLAARFHIVEKRSVSVYSLDHYRLAATEQLKSYANVMGIDFHAPLSKNEFIETMRRDGAEVILIDTSGVNWSEQERLNELSNYAQACRNDTGQAIELEINLIISANTNPSIIETMVASFDNSVGFDKFMLTKVDESNFIGNFIEIADRYKRPFSFIMNGQTVPADIQPANAIEMATMALGAP